MQSIQEELAYKDVITFSVSADPVEDQKEKLLSRGFDFPLLADPELILIEPLGLKHEAGNPMTGGSIARPAVLLVDDSGNILKFLLTENWRVRPTSDDFLDLVSE